MTNPRTEFVPAGGKVFSDGLCIVLYRRSEPSWFRRWMIEDLCDDATADTRKGLACFPVRNLSECGHGGLIREGYDYLWIAEKAQALDAFAAKTKVPVA